MSDPMWTTIDMIKSGEYGARKINTDEFDTVLTQLIKDVTAQMISYIDNPDKVDPTAPSNELKRACAKQVAYEWKRKEDIGLSSVMFPNGNVNKFSIDEWLPDVKLILQRNKYYAI